MRIPCTRACCLRWPPAATAFKPGARCCAVVLSVCVVCVCCPSLLQCVPRSSVPLCHPADAPPRDSQLTLCVRLTAARSSISRQHAHHIHYTHFARHTHRGAHSRSAAQGALGTVAPQTRLQVRAPRGRLRVRRLHSLRRRDAISKRRTGQDRFAAADFA